MLELYSSKNILGEVKCKFNGVQTDIKVILYVVYLYSDMSLSM